MKSQKAIRDYILTLVLGLTLCVVATGHYSTSQAADWPNWRGPNLNGISDETGWTATWPAEGPKILWKKSIGTGFASMAVSRGRLYAMGNIDNNDILYCFDAETGQLLWKKSYSEPKNPKNYEGGPNATPTVDGNRVYTFSKTGKVFCRDIQTGDVIWSKDLKQQFGVKPPDWGISGSPLVLGDMVILNAGTWGIAFSKTNGDFIWQNGKGPGGYATPVPFTVDGCTFVALFGEKAVAGVVVATGVKVWDHTWETMYNVNAADPIVSGDTIFISSGYGKGCALLKLEGSSVTEVYRNKRMRNQCNSSVLWKGHIYGFDGQVNGGGKLTCIDYKTSDVKWSQGGLGTGSLMLADGKLIVLGEKGKLAVVEACPDGYKELASAQILPKKRCWTVPVLANGRIYARNAVGDLVCVDVRAKAGAAKAGNPGKDWPQFRGPNRDGKSPETGLLTSWPEAGPELLWFAEGLGTGFSSIAIADGYVYTAGMVGNDKKGILFAYDLDGNPKWEKFYGPEWSGSHESARTTPTIDGDRVYVMSGYGNLVCFDAKTGDKKWEVDTLKRFDGKNIKWGIAESVLIFDDKLICTPGGKDATVVALDKMTSKTIWTTKGLSETSAYCSPVVIERSGKRLIATMVQKSIVLIDPENGNILYRIPHIGKHFISAVSPVYKDDLIYGTTGYGVGGEMYELSPDPNSYTQRWTDKNLDCHHGGLILLDGNIHGSNHRGQSGNKGSWICLELASGKVKYTGKLVGKGSVIFAEGLLYCYGESGMLGLVKATPIGYEMVSSFKITKGTDEHWAHPAISNGRLYIRHGDALMVYDIRAKL